MANLRWLRLPAEMRGRKQWAVATLQIKENGKPDKAPRHPIDGRLVSSTDPASWASFEDCINSGYPAIGYMLDAEDPFTIIDLDAKEALSTDDRSRQHKVYEVFESYAERSQSGHGVHIILLGQIGGGFNRDGIEAYDQERFMICTGDVVRDSDIRAHPELLAKLVQEMGGASRTRDLPDDLPETRTDAEILEKLHNAKNADKFKDLYYNVPGPGDDWSQRDASLAQMIAFYTRNHDQALRLFRGSKLYRPNSKGKSPAHYESYYLLERTFGRAWLAEAARDADVEVGREMAARIRTDNKEQAAPAAPIMFPPGLVGEVARFIYGAAPRPVAEIALAGALTFCSGLLGRQYNISMTGLNLYVVLVANTGRGKEGASSGVDALVKAVRQNMPIIDTYRGPGHIASGQALIKSLDEHPSSFAFLSEFGHILKIITDPRASASDIRTRQVLLDLFSKSGQHQVLQSSIYSDREKNTKSVQAPCFAFMGDTTPEVYYGSFNSALVAEGLLPRFLTITYDGPRVPANKAPNLSPAPELIDRLTSIVTSLANMFHSNSYVDIMVEPPAQAELDKFDILCDAQINAAGAERSAELWNRAHLKVLRLAGLIAVGKNHFEPRVALEDVIWARDLITGEMARLFERMESGAVGSDEVRQLPTVVEAVRDYFEIPKARRIGTYGVSEKLASTDYIPYGFFRRKFRTREEFIHDRRGATAAIKSTLQDAVELGYLQELSDAQRGFEGLGITAGKVYTLGLSFPDRGKI